MSAIHDYHSKPTFKPIGKAGFSRDYLGVELEFEVKDPSKVEAVAGRIADLLGDFAVLKGDASLDYGFEICTRPALVAIHKERWQPVFENGLEDVTTFSLLEESGEEKQNCGMHVHINREPLSQLQIGKIITFIHNSDNYEFVKTIAGRASNDFCNYRIPRSLTDVKPEKYFELNRRTGVNLHNLATVEIRIFKSTTDFEIFLKNLEFCEALIQFSAPSRTPLQDSCKYEQFIEFLKECHVFYPNLFNFLKQEKYIAKKATLQKIQTKLQKTEALH